MPESDPMPPGQSSILGMDKRKTMADQTMTRG